MIIQGSDRRQYGVVAQVLWVVFNGDGRHGDGARLFVSRRLHGGRTGTWSAE